jgi:hypothetical protein
MKDIFVVHRDMKHTWGGRNRGGVVEGEVDNV